MIQGTIIRVAGPVVDVKFTEGKLPALQEALTVTAEGIQRTMEVTQHVNETTVRCIMLSASEGLGKGMEVQATGHGLTAPVGEGTLGRMFDPLGRPIDGKGPVGVIFAISDSAGNVRGCCWDYQVELPPKADGKLDVGAAVGRDGTLTLIRDIGLREPYVGSSQLVSGEIAEDIARYFALSEQIPTVCALGVLVNADRSIAAAGGYIAQLLPGAAEEEISALENSIGNIPSVTQMLAGGMTVPDIIGRVLGPLLPSIVEQSFAEYCCRCSRDKTRGILASLPKNDLCELIESDGSADVRCNFCGREYHFDRGELTALLDEQGR